MSRFHLAFGALVLGQAAHSVEEYLGKLYDSFPPARILTGLVSSNRQVGFAVLNVALVAFGVWCFIWPVRRGWRGTGAIVTFWVTIEVINGVGHPLWSWQQGGYTPGVLTAPILLVLALVVVFEWRRRSGHPAAT